MVSVSCMLCPSLFSVCLILLTCYNMPKIYNTLRFCLFKHSNTRTLMRIVFVSFYQHFILIHIENQIFILKEKWFEPEMQIAYRTIVLILFNCCCSHIFLNAMWIPWRRKYFPFYLQISNAKMLRPFHFNGENCSLLMFWEIKFFSFGSECFLFGFPLGKWEFLDEATGIELK